MTLEPGRPPAVKALPADERTLFDVSLDVSDLEGAALLERVDTLLADEGVAGPDVVRLTLVGALQRIKEKNTELQVIFLTGHPSVSTGIDAMKLGAVDFIPKPVDLNELTEIIKQAKVSRAILVEKQAQAKLKKALSDNGR